MEYQTYKNIIRPGGEKSSGKTDPLCRGYREDHPGGTKGLGKSLVKRQTDEESITSLEVLQRVRYAAPDRVPQKVPASAAEHGYCIARAPVLMEGRIEMMHYAQNQSICDNYLYGIGGYTDRIGRFRKLAIIIVVSEK